jgi:hypothetical protein
MTLTISKSNLLVRQFSMSFLVYLCVINHTHSNLAISFVDHPQIQTYVEIVKRSYAKANINIVLHEVPQEQGLIAVNAGIADGDVARTSNSIGRYSNLITVGKPLLKSRTYLMCLKTVKCHIDLLTQPDSQILVTAGQLKGLPESIRGKFRADAYVIDSFKKFDQLLKNAAVDYAILIYADGSQPEKVYQAYQGRPLYESDIYHVLHVKHQALAEKLAPHLNQEITQSR